MLDPAQQGFMNQQPQPSFANPFGGQYPAAGFGAPQHAKSFSLPVSFDSQQQQQILPPPERACNAAGDVPLPPGWVSEKAPSGQIYFYNQSTKQSSWEDPRKMYNLPMYQNEMSYEMRAHIYKSIPMPSGWAEERTEAGRPYFVNHNTRMTYWEDPRIAIYMQQEQQKYTMHQNQYGMPPQQQIATQMQSAPAAAMPVQSGFGKSPYPNADCGFVAGQQQQQTMPIHSAVPGFGQQQTGFGMQAGFQNGQAFAPNPGSAVKSQQQHLAPSASVRMSPMLAKSPAMHSNASLHSASLTSLSNSPSSSSLSSGLSSSQELLSTSASSATKPLANFSNTPNSQYIQSLRRSLDKVLESKQSICNQLNELVEQENMIKAKMRPQDIEEVMKLIKEGNMRAKVAGPAMAAAESAPKMLVHTAATIAPVPQSSSFADPSHSSHNTTDPGVDMDQLDSTLVVADTSANNSNVMNE